MDIPYAVQPLIFYAVDARDDSRLAARAIETLELVRDWYARQLGSTFALDDCVVFRSALSESQWRVRHRRDGKPDEQGIWIARVHEARAAGAISSGDTRIQYYISSSPAGAGRYGWALHRDNFGHGAYLAGPAAQTLAGDRVPRIRGHLFAAGAIAGMMAHELAHCFAYTAGENLPNRSALWDSNVMGAGYLRFPKCRLDREQKMILLQSPFLTTGPE